MSRVLIAAAFGIGAAFAALVLYVGVGVWSMNRAHPLGPDEAVGFDIVAMPLWTWLALAAIFAAAFALSYRHVK